MFDVERKGAGPYMQKELLMRDLPTAFCHASNVIVLRTGELFCCWFGGTHEGDADCAIFASRRTAAGWTKPQVIVNSEEANWNPVLCYLQDGTLALFCKTGQKIADWKTLLLTSQDGGLTWSNPRELVPGDATGGRGPVRTKVLRLADGSLLAGTSTERGLWMAYADHGDAQAKNWRRSEPIAIDGLQYTAGERTTTAQSSDIAVSEQSFYGRGVIQPSLWQDGGGGVHMLLRSSEGHIYRSDSPDGGQTWTEARKTTMPNNNSGLDVVYAEGRLWLVCNPVAANWGVRSPLSLFVSDDNGYSWNKLCDLETSPHEYSYPCIIANERELIITYTYRRENIACVHYPI